jgi:phage gp16-like protein
MRKDLDYFRYRRRALDAPKARPETRAALVPAELGLSEEEFEGFYYVNREGAQKRHFDYHAFAKKYGVSTDWIFDGFLPGHPRGLKRRWQPRRTNSEAMKQKREMRDTIRGRIKDVSMVRGLTAADIKGAMTTISSLRSSR